jgi:hypothetical protein
VGRRFPLLPGFRGIQPNDKITDASDDEWGSESSLDDQEGEEPMDESDRNPKGPALPKPGGTFKDFPFYVSSGKGVLYVPDKMTADDFKLLKKQIENSLAVIEATAVVESSHAST